MRKNAVKAARLRDQGLTIRQICEQMGLSRSMVAALLYDPDGSKDRARKASYGGTCEVCGGPTDGSNGRAKAPKRCLKCQPRAEHGTRSRYASGCSCDACRAAHRAGMRALKGKEPRQHGTQSAYSNYGCRCDACREAHREYERSHPEYKKRWKVSVRGTWPPRHGTAHIYSRYGCRCDACTAAYSEATRARRERRKARTA